jgi:glycosyltransferase involved in cell wall biosynthesis
MNLLFIASYYPMADRNSGDFRFSQIIRMCTEECKVFFLVLNEPAQIDAVGKYALQNYKEAMANIGITVLNGGTRQALTYAVYDAVIFEWHFTAKTLAKDVRLLQPQARLLIDSVDIVFNRYQAKARLTADAADILNAEQTKTTELAIYKASDLVITVSDADADILHNELPDTPTYSISNIHPLPPLRSSPSIVSKQLIFIGSFTHEPNIDAIIYFCSEILPLIQQRQADVSVCVVGNAPTEEILALASDNIKVLGYVPETTPYLESSMISIAPLRFGGGVKGKIGEAMSYGLPIVTTSIGAEGFGITPGKHLLVCDDAQSFAEAVIQLIDDEAYRIQIGHAARTFIIDHYSDKVSRERVRRLLANLKNYTINRPGVGSMLWLRVNDLWQQNVAWRFK